MGFAKKKSIKTSLFLHLAMALIISLILSTVIKDRAYEAEQRIWLKYTEDKQELYEFQNEYSEKFGDIPPIPIGSTQSLSNGDKILIEILNLLQTWSMLIVSFGSVFIVLNRFYKCRLKKPLDILVDSAEKIGKQDLNFYVEYEKDDEMGQLCETFDKMRQQLKENNQVMWKMLDEQKQMRAAFSHDLRTPLSVLKGYVEYLNRYYPEDRLSKDKIMETLQELADQTKRIEIFADTMKEINHLDERKITPELLDKSIIIRKSESILNTLAEKYGKRYSIQENLQQEQIKLDLDIYLEVLENIAANGMRYAKTSIRLELIDIESWLHMNIYDDGVGFSKEALKSAQKAFYHEWKEDDEDHYGIGLYLCENLCKKHGGKLSIGNYGTGGAVVKAQFKIK